MTTGARGGTSSADVRVHRVEWHSADDRLSWPDGPPLAGWTSLRDLLSAEDPATGGVVVAAVRLVVDTGGAGVWQVRGARAVGGLPADVLLLLSGKHDGTTRGWVVDLGPADLAPPHRSEVIDQAKGVLVARYGMTPGAAFDELSRLSQNSNRKVATVAADLVHDAAGQGASTAHDASVVHRLVDIMVTPALLLAAERDEAGRVVDFTVEHANPAAVDLDGRTAPDLTGRRLLSLYPGLVESGVFDLYVAVLVTDRSYPPRRTPYVERTRHGTLEGTIELSAHRVDPDHVVVTWMNDPEPHEAARDPDRTRRAAP